MTYYCKDTEINHLDEKISLKTGKPMDEDEFREYLLNQIERTLPHENIQGQFTICIKNDVCITSICSWVQLELDKKHAKNKYKLTPQDGKVVKVTLGQI
jgi:hypothetical protein